MLNIPTANKKAAHNTTSIVAPKMEAQQHLAVSSKTSREKTRRSQRVPRRGHIKDGSDNVAYQERLTQIKKRLVGRSTETDASLNKQIAARINIATNRTWGQTKLTGCEMKAALETTANSSSDSGKSNLIPESDVERSAGPATDRTSGHGRGNVITARKLSEVLMAIIGRYGELQGNLRDSQECLCEKDGQHQGLERKYAEQRKQRLRDKGLVDSWSQEVATMDAYCEKIYDANRVLKDRFAEATTKHQADLHRKDQDMTILKADHELVVAAMTTETKKWHKACGQKDSAFQTAVTRVTTERNEIQRKASLEKKKILRVHRAKADDLQSRMEALEMKNNRIIAEYEDAISKNEETIISLKARNQQLEKEHETMSQIVRQKFSTERELQRVMDANTAGKRETAELRAKVKRLETHVEDLLDTIQNTEKDVTRHREAEQDMRAASNCAKRTIQLQKDKLTEKRNQICDLAEQLELVQQGAVGTGAHCAALDAIEQEKEQLRNSLQAERDKKTDMKAKFDRLDDDNLRLSIEYDIMDVSLIREKKFSSALRESIKETMHELRILKKVAQGQQGVLGYEDHLELLELVSRTTAKNKSLVEAKADIEENFQKIEQWSKTITDKCESEVMKAKSGANYWFELNYNKAIPTTERLHNEIAALKAEKGEQHFVEPTPPINAEVYDRKMLPFAMIDGLQGVPAELIPSAVYDPKFRECISPTEAALRTLRPQGWRPVHIAGKVWLSRTVEPLSEEAAALQVQTNVHSADLVSAGSRRSSVSNTYAPRNPYIPGPNAHNERPANASNPRTPSLTHGSSRRAHSPMTPEHGDRAAAGREAARPITTKLPSHKPQNAQTPTSEAPQIPQYQSSWQQLDERMTRAEWDDLDHEIKIYWVAEYLKPKDD